MTNAPAAPVPATTRLFGRCPAKGCTTRIVLDPAADARVHVDTVRGHRGQVAQVIKVDAPPRTDLGHGAMVAGRGLVVCATKHGHGELSGPSCEAIRWEGVKATTNAMECGPHCWNARSADCKCSCGGAHHGETA